MPTGPSSLTFGGAVDRGHPHMATTPTSQPPPPACRLHRQRNQAGNLTTPHR